MVNVTEASASETLKESSLEAIGYICQDIVSVCIYCFDFVSIWYCEWYYLKNPEILESQSNQILTAIVNGMRKEEPSDHVRLAACNALLNSLEFTRNNFSKEVKKHQIFLLNYQRVLFGICLIQRFFSKEAHKFYEPILSMLEIIIGL